MSQKVPGSLPVQGSWQTDSEAVIGWTLKKAVHDKKNVIEVYVRVPVSK